MSKLEAELERLATLSPAELRAEWERVYGTSAPMLSDDLLRRGVAYRLQEKACGGLSRTVSAALRSSDCSRKLVRPTLKPGTQIVRSWNGRHLTVTVEENGFLFEDRQYGSLSAIARTVTGTAWSGPRFFGLDAHG